MGRPKAAALSILAIHAVLVPTVPGKAQGRHSWWDRHAGDGPGAHPWEYAGTFSLSHDAPFRWVFSRKEGTYADADMTFAWLPAATDSKDAIANHEAAAKALFGTAATAASAGAMLAPATLYRLVMDTTAPETTFRMQPAADVQYMIAFMQHLPSEYEGKTHWLLDAEDGAVQATTAEEHGHGYRNPHDEHDGHRYGYSNEDTPGWDNGTGRGCDVYISSGYCAGGAVTPGHTWTMGAAYRFPEHNCVACGKKTCHCVYGEEAKGEACWANAQICTKHCYKGYHAVPHPAGRGFDCVAEYQCRADEYARSTGMSHHIGHALRSYHMFDHTHAENRVCTAVSQCSAKQYESAPPTKLTDRVCAAHTACTSAQYETRAPTAMLDRTCATKLCTCAGGSGSVGAACAAHSLPACAACDEQHHLIGMICVPRAECTEDEYERFSDGAMHCTALRVCTALQEYETVPPTETSDRRCTATVLCSASQYEAEAPTATSNRRCATKAVCAAGTYETVAPSASSDRTCTVCAAGTFKATAGSAACAQWRTCPAGHGQEQQGSATNDVTCAPCPATYFKSAVGNTACIPHRVCTAAEHETAAASETNNRECAIKQCTCTNGIATSGVSCAVHDTAMCNACVGSFHLSLGNQRCEANLCSCLHGTRATGAKCSTHNAEICTACHDGNHFRGSRCVKHTDCLRGTYIARAGTPSTDRVCTACPPGMFSDSKNAASCEVWRSCAVGLGQSTTGSATVNRGCVACVEGATFSDAASGAACRTLMVCDNDEYQVGVPNAASDRRCASHSTSCPSGQYTSTAPHAHADRVCSALTVCEAGTFETTSPSDSSDRVCAACAAGKFKDSDGYGACVNWRECPAGEGLLAEGSITRDRSCTPCVAGTSFSVQYDATQCQPVSAPCPAGQFMDVAATRSSDRQCALCPADHFKSASGNGACVPHTPCTTAQHETVAPTATSDTVCATKMCVCEHGSPASGVDCSAHGASKCSSCNAAFHLSYDFERCEANVCTCSGGDVATGALCTVNGAEACAVCHAGFHMQRFECIPFTTCEPGHYIRAEGSARRDRQCAPCPAGEFSVSANAVQCHAWRTCGTGFGRYVPGSPTNDLLCAPCEQGVSFSDKNDGATCMAVLECLASEYETRPATVAANRECGTHSASCSPGQYTAVAPHAHADRVCSAITNCAPGSYQTVPPSASSDRECAECVTGTFKAGPGNAACAAWRTCAPGFGQETPGSATADRVCEACAAGINFSASDGGDECQAVSSPCSASFYTNAAPTSTSDRTCARCRPGFFKSTAGDEACKQWSACPIGQGETQPGSSSTDRECSPCTLGADFSPVNSGGPCQAVSKACPAGEYRSVEATLSSDRICTACLPGYFKSAQGNEACMLWRTCPRGQGQTSTGTAVADRSCAACALGKTFSTYDDSAPCGNVRDRCVAGKFEARAPTQAVDRVCRPCSAGTFSSVAGAKQCSEWRKCAIGSGQLRHGTVTADRECARCIVQVTFSDAFDGRTCQALLRCSAGEYELVAATISSDRQCASHSTSCPSGQYTSTAPHAHADRVCSALTVCEAGTFETTSPSDSSDRVCAACAAGKFKDSDGYGACVNWRECPAGEGLLAEGSITRDRSCTPCVAGTSFSVQYDATQCQPVSAPCPAGQFMDVAATRSSDRQCALCPADHFKSASGNGACVPHTPCTTAQHETVAPTATSDTVCATKMCVCEHGSPASGVDCSAHGASKCSSCNAAFHLSYDFERCEANVCTCSGGDVATGALCTVNGAEACAVCHAGFHMQRFECIPFTTCEPGHYIRAEGSARRDRQCAPCPAGEFSVSANAVQCHAWRTCGTGFGRYVPGSPTNDLLCAPCEQGVSFSNKDSGETCRPVSSPCAPGLYLDVTPTPTSDRVCAECVAGFFKGTQGNNACAQWRTCPIGYGKLEEGSTTADRVCKECSPGSFSDADSGDACRPLLICGTDEYQATAPTSSSDRECASHSGACPEGQFTSKGATALADRVCHAITTCAAGKFMTATFSASSDRVCAHCPSGTFQNVENEDSCIACDAGKHRTSQPASSAEAMACANCTTGRVSVSAGATMCTRCVAGMFQPHDGETECEECSVGMFQHQTGESECISCTAGKHRSGAAASSAAAVACVSCPSGTYQHLAAKLDCIACIPGKSRNSSPASSLEHIACTACAVGSFQDKRGSVECIDCAAGKHRSVAPASSAETEACTPCTKGHFQPSPAQLRCTACDRGKHRRATASAAAAETVACANCEPGRYQATAARFACHECAPGKFRNSASATASEQVACTLCAAGHYQHAPAQLNCIACATGKFRSTASAASAKTDACVSCPHGRFQPRAAQVGRAVCKACAPGRFPTGQQSGCADHNTMEHVCHLRRTCEATAAFKLMQVPAALNKNRFSDINQWCDYECAHAPDRWLKDYCPHGDGTMRKAQMCQCHERRSPTVIGRSQEDDQECNDHEVCSHVYCKKEFHNCPAHARYRQWASKFPTKRVASNVCDDGVRHQSIRVFHHGHETTCKHGHLCFMKGEHQCVCVQQTPARPDVDRCWHDVKTEVSKLACFRLCQAGDAEGCAASAGFRDTEPPVIRVCGGESETVTAPDWHPCRSRAMDQVDGDLTDAIRYKLARVLDDSGTESLGVNLPFYGMSARFHQLNVNPSTKLWQDFGRLIPGTYVITMSVCDAAQNCATVEKAVSIDLPIA